MSNIVLSFMLLLSVLHHITFIYDNEVLNDFQNVANFSSCQIDHAADLSIIPLERTSSAMTFFLTLCLWCIIFPDINHFIIALKNNTKDAGVVYVLTIMLILTFLVTFTTTLILILSYKCKGVMFYWSVSVMLSKTLHINQLFWWWLSLNQNKTQTEDEEEKFKKYFN